METVKIVDISQPDARDQLRAAGFENCHDAQHQQYLSSDIRINCLGICL